MVLYILADLISFLEIQRLQLVGSSSTVFAANLILYDNKLAKKQVKQRVRGVADSRISCLLVILLFVCLQPRSNKRKCFYHLHGIILSNGFLGLLLYRRVVFKPILVKPFW